MKIRLQRCIMCPPFQGYEEAIDAWKSGEPMEIIAAHATPIHHVNRYEPTEGALDCKTALQKGYTTIQIHVPCLAPLFIQWDHSRRCWFYYRGFDPSPRFDDIEEEEDYEIEDSYFIYTGGRYL